MGYPCPLPFGPACCSPTSFLTKLLPCFIALRLHVMPVSIQILKLYTKSETNCLNHTQTPVRSSYRSHPPMVIEETNQGIQEVINRKIAIADLAKAATIRSNNYLRIRLPLRSKVHSAGPRSASNAETSANGLAAINCF